MKPEMTPFGYWMRTGRVVPADVLELKYNHIHGPDGRFASSPGGAGSIKPNTVRSHRSRNGKYTIIDGRPAIAVPMMALDGAPFIVPPYADFYDIYSYGKYAKNITLPDQKIWLKNGIGQFGIFDFQRQSNGSDFNFIPEYVAASNYAVGVAMNGAGYSLATTHAIGRAYALKNSKNSRDYIGATWWTRGWNDANKGRWIKYRK